MHVRSERGQAKFWLEPGIELAKSSGLSNMELVRIRRLIEEHEKEIREAWSRHFGP